MFNIYNHKLIIDKYGRLLFDREGKAEQYKEVAVNAKEYDYVVSNEEDLDKLLGSNNWLGAKKVLFRPNTFDLSQAITIPSSVELVDSEGLKVPNVSFTGHQNCIMSFVEAASFTGFHSLVACKASGNITNTKQVLNCTATNIYGTSSNKISLVVGSTATNKIYYCDKVAACDYTTIENVDEVYVGAIVSGTAGSNTENVLHNASLGKNTTIIRLSKSSSNDLLETKYESSKLNTYLRGQYLNLISSNNLVLKAASGTYTFGSSSITWDHNSYAARYLVFTTDGVYYGSSNSSSNATKLLTRQDLSTFLATEKKRTFTLTHNLVKYTPDGSNLPNFQEIIYGNGVFLAIPEKNTPNSGIYISFDGISWETTFKTFSYSPFVHIKYLDGIFFAMGDEDTAGYEGLIYSYDGIRWIRVPKSSGVVAPVVTDICKFKNDYVVVGTDETPTHVWARIFDIKENCFYCWFFDTNPSSASSYISYPRVAQAPDDKLYISCSRYIYYVTPNPSYSWSTTTSSFSSLSISNIVKEFYTDSNGNIFFSAFTSSQSGSIPNRYASRIGYLTGSTFTWMNTSYTGNYYVSFADDVFYISNATGSTSVSFTMLNGMISSGLYSTQGASYSFRGRFFEAENTTASFDSLVLRLSGEVKLKSRDDIFAPKTLNIREVNSVSLKPYQFFIRPKDTIVADLAQSINIDISLDRVTFEVSNFVHINASISSCIFKDTQVVLKSAVTVLDCTFYNSYFELQAAGVLDHVTLISSTEDIPLLNIYKQAKIYNLISDGYHVIFNSDSQAQVFCSSFKNGEISIVNGSVSQSDIVNSRVSLIPISTVNPAISLSGLNISNSILYVDNQQSSTIAGKINVLRDTVVQLEGDTPINLNVSESYNNKFILSQVYSTTNLVFDYSQGNKLLTPLTDRLGALQNKMFHPWILLNKNNLWNRDVVFFNGYEIYGHGVTIKPEDSQEWSTTGTNEVDIYVSSPLLRRTVSLYCVIYKSEIII